MQRAGVSAGSKWRLLLSYKCIPEHSQFVCFILHDHGRLSIPSHAEKLFWNMASIFGIVRDARDKKALSECVEHKETPQD